MRGPASERAPWNASCTRAWGDAAAQAAPRRPTSCRWQKPTVLGAESKNCRGAWPEAAQMRRAQSRRLGHVAGTQRARGYRLRRSCTPRRERNASRDHAPQPVRPRRRPPGGGGPAQSALGQRVSATRTTVRQPRGAGRSAARTSGTPADLRARQPAAIRADGDAHVSVPHAAAGHACRVFKQRSRAA